MESQQLLSPSSTGRRSSFSTSPEFEFWMVRNPSFPQPNLLSADELFLDGVLRPLHLLHHHPPPHPQPDLDPPNSIPQPGPQMSSPSPLTSSKRWKDIFKKNDKKPAHEDKDREKEKKREKKSPTRASSAELNINIWPFSRSRSAGNNATRPRMFPGASGTRKVSSAPCSRSNSAGEYKSRKWSNSPGRSGVHLGRSSPVWQVRRSGEGGGGVSTTKNAYNYSEPAGNRGNEKVPSKKEVTETRRSKATGAAGGGGSNTKSKVVNLNVPMCMGYRQNISCRSGGGRSGGNSTVSGGNNFNLLGLFTKKVY